MPSNSSTSNRDRSSSFKLFNHIGKAPKHDNEGVMAKGELESRTPKKHSTSPAGSIGHHISSALFNKKTSPTVLRPPIPVKSSSSLSNLVSHSSNPFSHKQDTLGGGTGITGSRNHHGGQKHNHRHDSNDNPLKSRHLNKENIVYNPYGIKNNNNTPVQNDISFYMQEGDNVERLLPLPVADPNEFLPEHLIQFSCQLTDNFNFDKDNKFLGAGSSSEVKRVKSAFGKKEVYALKKLTMVHKETPEKFYKRCSKEFIIAKDLSCHIHVSHTFFLMRIPTSKFTSRGWGFIMELCVGDLFQLIERTGWSNVPATEKYCIFKQVAEGLRFIHSKGIAHRDIKPENILLTKSGICKLTDFGISDYCHVDPMDVNSPIKMCEGIIGSTPYAPPEVMVFDDKRDYPKEQKKPYNPILMDCYGLGILFFAIMNAYLPFVESSPIDPKFRDFETSYDNYISHLNKNFRVKGNYKPGPGGEYKLARGFLNTDASRVGWRLCDPVAETRYSMDDLFNDPWFKQVETCIDEEDVEYNNLHYKVMTPELRLNDPDKDTLDIISDGASTNSAISNFTNNSKDDVSEIPRPRTMVDIALAPDLSKRKHPKEMLPHPEGEEKMFKHSTVGEIDVEKHISDITNHKVEFSLYGEKGEEDEEKGTEEGSLGNSSETPNNIDDVLEENESESKEHLVRRLNSLKLTKVYEDTISDTSELETKLSSDPMLRVPSVSSSIKSTNKKRVVHHHLDVPNSVQHVPSMRSFSDR